MTVNSNGSVGSAGTTATAGAAQTFTFTTTDVTAGSSISVSMVINGQTYTQSAATQNTAGVVNAVKAIVAAAFGGAVSVTATSSTVTTIVAAAAGTNLGSIGTPTVTGTSLAGGATVVAQTVAPVTAIATTALSELETITFGGGVNSTDIYAVQVNGRSVQVYVGNDQVAAATAAATQINALYGSNIATANGKTVTVQGAVGVALPAISATVTLGATTSNTPTASTTVLSSAAAAAANAAVYDVSGFTGLNAFNTTSYGGDNIKVAGTTNATITNTNGGGVTLEGGNVVNITTSGTTSAVSVKGKALSAVNITGGTGATVNNQENTTAATDNAGTTLTTVSLTKVDGNSTVGGKGLVNVTVAGATTDARTVTITNSTVNHAQNLTLVDTGYKADGTTEVQTVITDAAATSLNVVSSGVKNSVNLSNNTVANTLTISGAGNLKANVGVSSLVSINGSAATGNLTLGSLNAATLAVTTGSGNDALTIAATAATSVSTNAGNDVVTLGSTVAAGSTVALGDGNDTLLSASGSVATGASASGRITSIDGGAGTDTLVASLVNSGNKALFTNFEILGLDVAGGATFDTTLVSGITGLNLVAASSATYTGLTTSQSLEITNTTTAANTVTLTMTGVSGTADTYAISFNGAAQTSVPTQANVFGNTVAVAGIENFTIASNGAANTWNKLTLGADTSANTVVISGAKNLDLAFGNNFGSTNAPATGVTLIDGSAATGKLAINVTNVVQATAGLTVKGGAAADTITTSSAAFGTLYGGAGADNFVVGATLAASATTFNTIADAAATDIITVKDQGTEVWNATAVNVSAAQSLNGAFAIALGTGNGSTNGILKWFVYSGNTYIVENNTDYSASAATGIGTADLAVKLVGVVDLANASVTGNAITIIA